MSCPRLSEYDVIADLTCGMGNFFNYAPVESNAYGCELEANAFKAAHFLYPEANLMQSDIITVKSTYVQRSPPSGLQYRGRMAVVVNEI